MIIYSTLRNNIPFTFLAASNFLSGGLSHSQIRHPEQQSLRPRLHHTIFIQNGMEMFHFSLPSPLSLFTIRHQMKTIAYENTTPFTLSRFHTTAFPYLYFYIVFI